MPTLTLAHGLVDTEGHRHRDAVLAPPDGRLEELLATTLPTGAGGSVHVRAAVRAGVLAQCLDALGGYERPGADVVAALTRGDGDLVALNVRRALVGDALALVVRCASPVCGELADVDVDVAELLPEVGEPDPEWFDVDAGAHGRARLRAATGVDDAALDGLDAPADERTATLMDRLVADAYDGAGTAVGPWRALPAPLRTRALVVLATAPTAPTTVLEVGCPSCGAVLELALDPWVLLARELRAGGGRLVLETHCLAFHYGWSQDEVYDLTRERRWAYLALLRAQLTGAALETAVDRG